MNEEYLVATYTRKDPSRTFKKTGSTGEGAGLGGMTLNEAERIAKDLTKNDFQPGNDLLAIIVNTKAFDNAPKEINIDF